MYTCPFVKDSQKMPFLTEAMISSRLWGPGSMYVARIRGMGAWRKGLAAAAARGLDTVVARAHAVVQVASQDAVLDEAGLLGEVAFVIDVDGASGVGVQPTVPRW